jgi:hypothetical protein
VDSRSGRLEEAGLTVSCTKGIWVCRAIHLAPGAIDPQGPAPYTARRVSA